MILLTSDPTKADEFHDSKGRYRLLFEEKYRKIRARGIQSEIDRAAEIMSTKLGLYRPLPGARGFHKSQAKVRMGLGGNGSSKSWSLSADCLLAALKIHPYRKWRPGSRFWYCNDTWDEVGKSYAQYFHPMLQGWPYKVKSWHNAGKMVPDTIEIGGPEYSTMLHFKAYEQGREAFQSARLDGIWADEQPSQDIFVEMGMRARPGIDLTLTMTCTPVIPMPWLEQRILALPDNWSVHYMPLDDNRQSRGGHYSDAQVDAMIGLIPPEQRPTRVFGKFGSYIGQIFTTFKKEVHVVDERRERELFFRQNGYPTCDCTVCGSIDWGGSNPFSFILGCKIPWLDNDWYIFDEIYWDYRIQGVRTLGQLADDVKKKAEKWKTHLERVYADHDAADRIEFAANDVMTIPAKKPRDSVNASIEVVQKALMQRDHMCNDYWPKGRPSLHIAKRCEKLIWEMPQYRWGPATGDKNAKIEPLDVNNHAISSLRYLLYTEQMCCPEPVDGDVFTGLWPMRF